MTISIEQVKELRDRTGVSIMQCKKALEEAEGDMEKALINLTKKSGEIAAKKGDRELGAGVIAISEEGDKGVIIELACETDFVASNEGFQGLAQDIAEQMMTGTNDFSAQTAEATQKFGERTEVSKSEMFDGPHGSYVHGNKSVGSVVMFSAEVDAETAKHLAMHIAAQNPKYLTKEEITEEEMAKAKEVLMEEVADKPADMQDKILEGKINAFFKERVLLEQAYIMDPSKSVAQVLPEGASITKFIRFGVGEA